MNVPDAPRWKLLDAACGDLVHAMWRRLCNPHAKPVPKAELNQWENEGGNLELAADAPDHVPANDDVFQTT